MAESNRTVAGALERAVAVVGTVNRRTLAWAGVALAVVTLLSVNLIASSALRNARFDLTEERLFTISEGTRKALAAIDEPIDIRVYFSKKLGELAPNYAANFERVRTMLEQYRDISRGKLRVTYVDPEPFSSAEERAVAAGLKGVRLNQEGEMGYFGIAGTNSTDTEVNLPFLAAERERFLEYDVTKLIVSLANQSKTTVGLISGIPLEGRPANPMLRQPPSKGAMMLDQMREFFEIRSIANDAEEIPSDIGVLMVVQPESLPAHTAYAIDQFALNGGKVLAFVDPLAETQRQSNPMMMMPQGPPDLAEFDKLLKAWGVAFDTSKLAADKAVARRVQFGSGPGAQVASYVLWLGLGETNLDKGDVLTGEIKSLNFASAGILAKAKDARTAFSPIITTTSMGMEVPAKSVSLMPDPNALLRDYKPGGTPLTLAARISGEAESAFPDGPPPPAESKDEKGKDAKGADKEADKSADAKADAKSKETKAKPSRPHIASGRVNVIVVADTDFLQDQFWLDVRTLLGQQVALPHAHNGAFVLAALENLTGSDALISLRARGVADRPFELVDELRREAEARYLASEQALTNRLNDLRTKLAKLQKEGSGKELVLTEKDHEEIEKFRADLVETQRELRHVKRELRKDIDRLDGMLKFVNIAGVPLLIGFIGIGLAVRRRRRPAHRSPAAEEVNHGA